MRPLPDYDPSIDGGQAHAQILQQLLDKHAPETGSASTRAPAATAKDVITYAHKLCYTTFAPAGYEAGVTVLHNFRPPMPQEWQLRASQLYAHSSEPAHHLSCQK